MADFKIGSAELEIVQRCTPELLKEIDKHLDVAIIVYRISGNSDRALSTEMLRKRIGVMLAILRDAENADAPFDMA